MNDVDQTRDTADQTASNKLTQHVENALFWAGFDHGGVADEVGRIVEQALRGRFKLTATDFDLSFTDMMRRIEDLLADRLGDALDRGAVADAAVEELLHGSGPRQLPSDCLDAQGRPDLQRLVELFGGYGKIPAEAWTRLDHDVASCQKQLRARPVAGVPQPANGFRLYPTQEECCRCYQRGVFGYRNKTGELTRFCADHRSAQHHADARRP
jgi:hypothetical protein